jgi:hypothetical protein
MTMQRAWAVALLTGACRLAGPEGSPTELIDGDDGATLEEATPAADPEENASSDGLEEPGPSDGPRKLG